MVSPQHFLLILFLELLKPASSTKYLAYVREWKKAMKEAYELAANRYRLSRMKGKRQYKRKDKSPVLRPGDRVSKKYTRKRRTWKIVILLGGGNLWSNQAERQRIQPGDRRRKGRLPDQLFCPPPAQPQKPVPMKRLRVC